MIANDSISRKAAQENQASIPRLGKLAYAALLLSGLVLAVTGIGTFALGRAPMSHWVLMLHASVTPLFALGLAVLALTWAGRSRFDGDLSWQNGVARTLFWLILLAGLIVILSGVVPMTPVFGTHGQHLLYLIHRYSAIVLTAALVLHWLGCRRHA
jgi:cytochrome b subunit of formate dehydrogenase